MYRRLVNSLATRFFIMYRKVLILFTQVGEAKVERTCTCMQRREGKEVENRFKKADEEETYCLRAHCCEIRIITQVSFLPLGEKLGGAYKQD